MSVGGRGGKWTGVVGNGFKANDAAAKARFAYLAHPSRGRPFESSVYIDTTPPCFSSLSYVQRGKHVVDFSGGLL